MLHDTYDPYTWRLDELEAVDAGLLADPMRREELIEGLLVAEAEELAHGRRHVSIVHGEPCDIVESADLDAFYDTVSEIVAAGEWSRVRGSHTHVTVTVAGANAGYVVAGLVDAAMRANPGHWMILETARPNL